MADNISSNFLVNSSDYLTATDTLLSNSGPEGRPLNDLRTGTPNANFFIGTNQVELSYNTTTNKFFWNFLHFPIYTKSGEIATRIIETNAPNFTMQTRNGCAAFISLSAKNNLTQEPFSFWDGLLGFDLGQLTVDLTHKLQFDDNGTVYEAQIPQVEDAINVTNAKVDLDSIVNKTGQNNYNYRKVINIADFGGGDNLPFVQNNFNTVVQAENITVSTLQTLTSPYFLVEMNAGFHTNLISTSQTSTTVQAIVNRYFSKGQYTTGSDSSLIYQHRGQPLVLSKFHTRILDPSRKVPVKLGDDNTIFIEIVRNNQFFLMQRQLEMQQELEAQRGGKPPPPRK